MKKSSINNLLIIISFAFLLLVCLGVTSCGNLLEEFTITYQGNGNTYGYPPVDNNMYKSGDEATVLGQHTLLKDGCTFSGWKVSSDNSGKVYAEGEKIKINNINIIFLAVWN